MQAGTMGWLTAIWKVVRAGWHTLAAAGTLVGILYLAPDVSGLPEVFPWLEGAMPSREALLIVFGIACVAYIAWIDLRPLVFQRLASIPEAIGPRELSFVFMRGDDLSLDRQKWSKLAPRVRFKNQTAERWNVRVAHWVFIVGDTAQHALDSATRPMVSESILGEDEQLVRFPEMPWRNQADSRKGALSVKLEFWQKARAAPFVLDVVYNFTLDAFGSELGREATQIIEDVPQQNSVAYSRHSPAAPEKKAVGPLKDGEPVGN
jgi:hypothetical protein